MVKLSKFDYKLLFEIDKNARQSFSTIAKKLKTSQQVVSYRTKSLEKRNVLDGYFAIINFSRLGYTNYRIMIRFSNMNEKSRESILHYLKDHKNVLWLVECSGKWDMIVNFMARNVFELNKDMNQLRSVFPEQIQNYDILTMVEVVWFGRDYFFRKQRDIKKNISLGNDFEPINIDKKDCMILSILSERARASVLEISQKTNISTKIVIKRIKQMQEKNLIQGFKPLIHLEHTPFTIYKALIKFQNSTEKKDKEIFNYLIPNPHVVGQLKFIGLWDFEVEFEVENKEQMLDFTHKFRDRFKDVIKEFETIQLNKEYKYNFFPRDLRTHT